MKYKTGDRVKIKTWAKGREDCIRVDGDGWLVFPSTFFPRSYWAQDKERRMPKDRILTLRQELEDGDWHVDELDNFYIPKDMIECHAEDSVALDIEWPDDQNRAELWGYLKLAELALEEGVE